MKKRSLKEKKQDKLSSLCGRARVLIDKAGVKEFTRSWLSVSLGVSDKEASQVASQLKKDLFLFGENNLNSEDGIARYRVR